ncbi:DUF1796 family putative cysteine peptidase [Spongiibacter tropicus]|uniref:DUF1796 family putative cysteine peptidase n=1 Tax=Spongiibacter tropicus TaxID=454602 RepID=UPI0035BE3497
MNDLIERVRRFFSNHSRRIDFLDSISSDDFRLALIKVNNVRAGFLDYLSESSSSPEFVSLGYNCLSAWYLKQSGLKRSSYPFDWIFSSPEIVEDCIRDDFEKYLDCRFFIDSGRHGAGHAIYHSSMFNHRDPRSSEKDFLYYKRSVKRFRDLKGNVVFFVTVVNEPGKRADWFNGFDLDFSAPQKGVGDLVSLRNVLKEEFPDSKLIVINYWTDSQKFDIKYKTDNGFIVDFHARGASDGVRFLDPLDDFLVKSILMSAVT